MPMLENLLDAVTRAQNGASERQFQAKQGTALYDPAGSGGQQTFGINTPPAAATAGGTPGQEPPDANTGDPSAAQNPAAGAKRKQLPMPGQGLTPQASQVGTTPLTPLMFQGNSSGMPVNPNSQMPQASAGGLGGSGVSPLKLFSMMG